MSARIPARRFVGAAILAVTMAATVALTSRHHDERPRNFTVGFIRGDRTADDTDMVESSIASLLSDHPDMKAHIVGYTEPGSDAEADMALSVSRAEKVKDALVAFGIELARLTSEGAGGRNPPQRLANETDQAWEHRAARAEITVSK